MCDFFFFFFSSRRRHTRCSRDWSSDVCSSDLPLPIIEALIVPTRWSGCRACASWWGSGLYPKRNACALLVAPRPLLPPVSMQPFPAWWTPSAHCTVRVIRSTQPPARPHPNWRATCRPWGYALHTASGSCSLELAGYFEGLGVRRCFGRLYGADLIGTFKEGPEY